MVNEQRYNVPLDSPIDINAENMLINVISPKMTFNKQRYLGSLLQNSVRYEADGWFAGWYGHNFEVTDVGQVNIMPSMGFDPIVRVITDPRQQPYYDITVGDLHFQATWNEWAVWQQGSGTVTRINDNTMRVTGTTVSGTQFTVETDVYTDEIVALDAPSYLSVRSWDDGPTTVINTQRIPSPEGDYIWIRKNQHAELNGISLPYSRDAEWSYFGNLLKLNDNGTVVAVDNDVLNLTTEIIDGGTLDEVVNVSLELNELYTLENDIPIVGTVLTTTFNNAGQPLFFRPNGSIAYDADSAIVNPQVNLAVYTARPGNGQGTNMAEVLLRWDIPIWMSVRAPLACAFIPDGEGSGIFQLQMGTDTGKAPNSIHGVINDISDPRWYLVVAEDEEDDNDIIKVEGVNYKYTDGIGWLSTPLNGRPASLITTDVVEIPAQVYFYIVAINTDSRCPVPVDTPLVLYRLKVDNIGRFTPDSAMLTLADTAVTFIDIPTNIVWVGNTTLIVPLCFIGNVRVKLQQDPTKLGIAPDIFTLIPEPVVTDLPYRIDQLGVLQFFNTLTDITLVASDLVGQVAQQLIITLRTSTDYLLYVQYKTAPTTLYPAFVYGGGVKDNSLTMTYSSPFLFTSNGSLTFTGTQGKTINMDGISNILALSTDIQYISNTPFKSTVQTGLISSDAFTSTLRINLNSDNYIDLQYIIATERLIRIGAQLPLFDIITESYNLNTEGTLLQVRVVLRRKLKYNIVLYRTFLLGAVGLMEGAQIVEQNSYICVLSNDKGSVNIRDGTLTNTQLETVNTTNLTFELMINVTKNEVCNVMFMPRGIVFKNEDIKWLGSTTEDRYYKMTFQWGSDMYILSISKNTEQQLVYSTRDIRTNEYREVYRRSLTDINMFVKQRWSNTVDTENYWYWSQDYIIELTKSRLLLWQRQAEVDDWMGDQWKIVREVSRALVIGTEDLQYGCTSAFNGEPRFYRLRATVNGLQVQYIDLLRCDWLDMLWVQVDVPVVTYLYGAYDLPAPAPSKTAITAYIPITPVTLLSTARVSSTVIEDRWLMLGFALTRGLLQWTVLIDMIGGTLSVITGYGHVGHDGSLTGGEIPFKCVGSNGFNKPLFSLNNLFAEQTIPNQCYSNGNTVWFLYTDIDTIVQALVFMDGQFSVIRVPLNNNTSRVYTNLSFTGQKTWDFGLNVKTAASLIGGGLTSNATQSTRYFRSRTVLFNSDGASETTTLAPENTYSGAISQWYNSGSPTGRGLGF